MSQPVTVRCEITEVRVKSLLVVDGARVSAWLPREAISVDGVVRVGARVRIALAADLAREKGLTTEVDGRQGRMF